MSIVTSISDLRTISGTSDLDTSQLLGYYSPGDGGGGLFYWNESSVDDDNAGTIIRPSSIDPSNPGRWIRETDTITNVKWFGAKGTGDVDDGAAIQNTVDFAKINTAGGGGTYRKGVYFPAGFYLISSAINLTNTNGIWLMGEAGSYINTSIIGCTPDVIFDFTGSTRSGCERFNFVSLSGYPTRSKIAIQFALSQDSEGNQLGGLNCSVKDICVQFDDDAEANVGIGNIGILNVRSEEFSVTNALIRANCCIAFSNAADFSSTGYSFTASSNFATIKTGIGSMGVVNFDGQTSLQSVEKRSPVLILNGTNNILFKGYLGRVTEDTGDNEIAILTAQSTYNLNVEATVESFSTLIKVLTTLENSTLDVVVANQTDPTLPVADFTGALITGLDFKLTFGNPSTEIGNRTILYHADIDSGNAPATGSIINSTIKCQQVSNNNYVISRNLLKQSNNLEMATGQPIKKENGWLKQLFRNKVNAGSINSTATAQIAAITLADSADTTSNDGGWYMIKISGVVTAGWYGSGGPAILFFNAYAGFSQANNAGRGPIAVLVQDKIESYINPTYAVVSDVNISITFTSNQAIVWATPVASGTGGEEPLYIDAKIEAGCDFYVNDIVLTA